MTSSWGGCFADTAESKPGDDGAKGGEAKGDEADGDETKSKTKIVRFAEVEEADLAGSTEGIAALSLLVLAKASDTGEASLAPTAKKPESPAEKKSHAKSPDGADAKPKSQTMPDPKESKPSDATPAKLPETKFQAKDHAEAKSLNYLEQFLADESLKVHAKDVKQFRLGSLKKGSKVLIIDDNRRATAVKTTGSYLWFVFEGEETTKKGLKKRTYKKIQVLEN